MAVAIGLKAEQPVARSRATAASAPAARWRRAGRDAFFTEVSSGAMTCSGAPRQGSCQVRLPHPGTPTGVWRGVLHYHIRRPKM